ncbi:MAG TPA: hypothetical protein VFX15_07505 [Actinomycetes bacterium]|nr:hypothetical protein [Actinomycetes bacterium]
MAASTVALTLTASAPAVLAPTTADAGRRIAGDSFEKSLAGWRETSGATRLDRVSKGRGAHSKAARLRSPKGRSATVGMTDAPALVRSSRKGTRYVATAWVKATPAAHRSRALGVRLVLGEMTSRGLGVHAWQSAHLGKSRWRKISVPFTARHRGRHLDLSIRAFDLRGGALLVDDVRIERVRKPSASNHRLRGVRFGASVDEGNLEFMRAVKLSDRRYSRMEVIRYYEPMIRDSWSGHLGDLNRPVTVSFTASPARVLDGDFNRTLRRWFRAAPNKTPIWWTYSHEPEDDIERGELSADRYRRAWRHINAIARSAGTRNLHPTLVLMAWTARSESGRSISKYYPGDFIDVMAFDGYNPVRSHRYVPPRQIFGAAVAKARHRGARFAIAELGSLVVPGDDGSRRATWLVKAAKYAAKKNAAFVSYWDAKIPGENFQLRDLPSRRAWHSVVKD